VLLLMVVLLLLGGGAELGLGIGTDAALVIDCCVLEFKSFPQVIRPARPMFCSTTAD
jgi:hypothetical protein